MKLEKLSTETPNALSKNLDKLSPLEFCKLVNEEDKKVAVAVGKTLDKIAEAITVIAEQIKKGGRLIYAGAGTSGRLGLLDAVECVPTFGVSDNVVIGLIAGGDKAFMRAVEGAEDSKTLAKEDLEKIKFSSMDVLCGIAASGRTPYVIGALEYADSLGAKTVSIACNKDAEISHFANIAIEVESGSEVLMGSTRLKAGTAQKMVLNMISTGVMTRLGKVYGNLMVDVLMTNEKLKHRAVRIIMLATGVAEDEAARTLALAKNSAKTAIAMILNKASYEEAKAIIEKNDGFLP
jgi:N-acetylmuramic acid 6-phosphate etherase